MITQNMSEVLEAALEEEVKESVPEKKKGFWARLFEPTKHDWELIHTEMMPSAIEQGMKYGCGPAWIARPEIWFRKCFVQTFKCKLTGEIWVKETYNP